MAQHDPLEDILNVVVEDFLAQQDVTRVRDPREEQIPQGELENFIMNLIQGADPTMGVFSGMAGLTPDDPDFKTQILIGLLTGGGLGALLRAGGRGLRTAGGAVARKLDPRPAMQEAADLVVPFRKDIREGIAERVAKAGDEALDELLEEFELFEQLGGKRLPTPLERAEFFQGKLEEFLKANPDQNTVSLFERRKLLEGRVISATEIAELGPRIGPMRAGRLRIGPIRAGRIVGRQAEDLRSIRQGIFEDLKKADPFGEAEEAHLRALDKLQSMILRRAGPRSEFSEGFGALQRSRGLDLPTVGGAPRSSIPGPGPSIPPRSTIGPNMDILREGLANAEADEILFKFLREVRKRRGGN